MNDQMIERSDAQMKQKKGSKQKSDEEDSEDEEEAPKSNSKSISNSNSKSKSNEVLVDVKTLKTLEYGAFESHGLKPL